MINPFEGYKVYGPYYHSVEKRRMINLIAGNHRTTMSYARYLMCMKLERWLDEDEHVDHIDDNKMNDKIDNLQILTEPKNKEKYFKLGKHKIPLVKIICPVCKTEFEMHKWYTAQKYRKGEICCSRSCSSTRQHNPDLYPVITVLK